MKEKKSKWILKNQTLTFFLKEMAPLLITSLYVISDIKGGI
jgi:hypothetical protein